MTHLLYKVTISAVDGESFYVAGGPDKGSLLGFLERYDHEGSTVTLDWCATGDAGEPGMTADPERVYRILIGEEEP